ncbi:MAG: SprT family zinc-dependent metalloprotease [Candidatus Omnitrophota bacterium]|nr:SprT family zinc-dependent metalloprotease [Candidatus Omnitrophota bacterium]MDZ4241602.1 SprT family zinc-dependent metalloprotease [Candidatus Omnitrophota bacterium]
MANPKIILSSGPAELTTSCGLLHYEMVRSRRRSLQISIRDSLTVRVCAPRLLPQKEIERFLRQKAAWVFRKLGEVQERRDILAAKKYEDGSEFLFLGRPYRLAVSWNGLKTARIAFDESGWTAFLPDGTAPEKISRQIKDALVKWYRAQALEVLGGRIFHYARIMGLEPLKITVRTQKRLWGSCHHRAKSINLNWLLILAPMDVIDYVVVHELCHLKVPNHSRRFWSCVGRVLPDFRERRQWLKTNATDMVLP